MKTKKYFLHLISVLFRWQVESGIWVKICVFRTNTGLPPTRCRFCVQPGVNCFHSRKVPDPFAGDSTFQPHNLSPFWACPVCSAAASWRLTSTEWWNPAQNGMAGKSLAIHNSDGKTPDPAIEFSDHFLSHNASTEWKPKPSTEWNTAIRLQPFHSVLVFRFHSVLALWLRKWSENSIPGSGVFFSTPNKSLQ